MRISNIESMITVIVPIYNVEDYVSECIESIINQTYKNLEIILVDDGSSDSSGQICDEYAEEDPRIVVIHKPNGGLSDARNAALDIAKGEYVAFVDGDDMIHSQMYEFLIRVLKDNVADISTCTFSREKDDLKVQYKYEEVTVSNMSGTEAMCDEGKPLVMSCNKLYKRELFDGIRFPKGKVHEDEFILHEIFYKCEKVSVTDKMFYFYRIRNDSIMSNVTSERINDCLEAYDNRLSFVVQRGWNDVLCAVIRQYCAYCINMYTEIEEKHSGINQELLACLWNAERKIVFSYPQEKIWKGYRIFAESPGKYYKWKKKIDKIQNLKSKLKKMCG